MSAQVAGGNPAALIRQNYVIEMDENDQPEADADDERKSRLIVDEDYE